MPYSKHSSYILTTHYQCCMLLILVLQFVPSHWSFYVYFIYF